MPGYDLPAPTPTTEQPGRRGWLIVVGLVALVSVSGSLGVWSYSSSQVSDTVARLVPYRFPLVHSGRSPAESLAAAEAKLASRPDSVLCRSDYAAALYAIGRFDAAEQAARESLALRETTAAHLMLAMVMQARHQFAESLDAASQLRAGGAAAAESRVLTITALLGLGRSLEAVPVAEELVDMMPTAPAYLQRALVLESVGRLEEAEADYARAVEREQPGDPAFGARARTRWGRFCLRHDRLADARVLLREAVRIDATNDEAFGLLAETESRLGDRAGGQAHFRAAWEVRGNPRWLIVQARYAPAAEAQRLRATAQVLLEELLAALRAMHLLEHETTTRRDWQTLVLLANAQRLCGRMRAARRTIGEVLASGVCNDRARLLADQIEEAVGR